MTDKLTIRASSLERVLKCSHSLRLPVEKSESIYAQTGTNEHALAFSFLTDSNIQKKKEYWNQMVPNTRLYVQLLNDMSKQHNLHFEKTYKKEYENFILQGTPDCWYQNGDTVYVFDLKNGYQDVDPWVVQLQCYAILVSDDSVKNLQLIIVQNQEIKTITLTLDTVQQLIKHINKSLDNHSYIVGDHCMFCPSKIHCLKMREPIAATNTENSLKLIRNKSHIKKMIDELQQKFYEQHPEWFIERRCGRGIRLILKEGVGDDV